MTITFDDHGASAIACPVCSAPMNQTCREIPPTYVHTERQLQLARAAVRTGPDSPSYSTVTHALEVIRRTCYVKNMYSIAAYAEGVLAGHDPPNPVL